MGGAVFHQHSFNGLCRAGDECTTFQGHWRTLEKSLTRCMTGEVNTASTEGLELARSLKILPSALPLVLIFNEAGDIVEGQQVSSGRALPAKKVRRLLKKHLRGLAKDSSSGYFLKRGKGEAEDMSGKRGAARPTEEDKTRDFLTKDALSRFSKRYSRLRIHTHESNSTDNTGQSPI